MSLGGSDYYLIAGDSVIVAAVLMWRGNAWGLVLCSHPVLVHPTQCHCGLRCRILKSSLETRYQQQPQNYLRLPDEVELVPTSMTGDMGCYRLEYKLGSQVLIAAA